MTFPARASVSLPSSTAILPFTIDEIETFRVLMRLCKCRLILHLRGIEDHQIGGDAFANQARDRGSPNVRAGNDVIRRTASSSVITFSFANILGQHPGVGPIRPRDAACPAELANRRRRSRPPCSDNA